MIKKIEEFNQHAAIAGFKNVTISNIEDFFQTVQKKTGNTQVQFFDASLTAGWQHLYFAALNALNAFKNKRNFSNSLAIETLLFASAQRQIKKAMDMIGIKPAMSHVAVLVVAENEAKASAALETISGILSAERDDGVLDFTDEKIDRVKKLFEISDLELGSKIGKDGSEKEALLDLVIERSALLITQR